jgi:hypothetical protein
VIVALEVVGWFGAAGLLAAFGLLARGRLTAASRPYIVLNLGGSAALAAGSAAVGAWPSVALNVVWLAIGLVTIIRPARATRPAPSCPPVESL